MLALLIATAPSALEADQAALLRVVTSGDYAPFSVAGRGPSEAPGGFGPDLIRAYATERGLTVRFVSFRWPDLSADLASGRFDVAVGGITVRPERSLVGRFTVPVATSGAVVLVRAASSAESESDLHDPGVRIGVNRGGHLERVTRARFARAQLHAIPDNAAVLPALLDGSVDAVVTDTLEAPHWQRAAPGTRLLGPFTQDRKAFLVAADREDLARDLDAWLLAREADGTLARLRAQHLGEANARPPTAAPLAALLAALDERLALMPAVAEAKRASGGPVEVPEREARVLDAAVASVRRASTDETTRPLTPEREQAVRALFRAQIEAAKAIQQATLAEEPSASAGPQPDLDTELRPALIRIGDRIARLVVALPPGLDPVTVREATQIALQARGLDTNTLDALAAAIVASTTTAPATRDEPVAGRADPSSVAVGK